MTEPVTLADIKDEDFARGKDNSGNPRLNYVRRVLEMTEAGYLKEAEHKIWLSAYAANNPKSDYHWHIDALFWIGERNFPGLYDRAYKRASPTL